MSSLPIDLPNVKATQPEALEEALPDAAPQLWPTSQPASAPPPVSVSPQVSVPPPSALSPQAQLAPRPSSPPPASSGPHLALPVKAKLKLLLAVVGAFVVCCLFVAILMYFHHYSGPAPLYKAADKVLQLPNGVSLGLIKCEPGTFKMGSPWYELDRISSQERPHKVRISQGFYLGQFEVTQEQYQAVMGDNPSYYEGDWQRPVEQVSWNDAQEFCKKLKDTLSSQLPGYKFCLPTEAQWEYACRAGSTGAYSGGGGVDELAWYGTNSGDETHPVGKRLPNAWGFYDMHGNVWEWCNDWFAAPYSGETVDPQGPASGSFRLSRGGSFHVSRRNSLSKVTRRCRSACRYYYDPDSSSFYIGFRLAATPVK